MTTKARVSLDYKVGHAKVALLKLTLRLHDLNLQQLSMDLERIKNFGRPNFSGPSRRTFALSVRVRGPAFRASRRSALPHNA